MDLVLLVAELAHPDLLLLLNREKREEVEHRLAFSTEDGVPCRELGRRLLEATHGDLEDVRINLLTELLTSTRLPSEHLLLIDLLLWLVSRHHLLLDLLLRLSRIHHGSRGFLLYLLLFCLLTRIFSCDLVHD